MGIKDWVSRKKVKGIRKGVNFGWYQVNRVWRIYSKIMNKLDNNIHIYIYILMSITRVMWIHKLQKKLLSQSSFMCTIYFCFLYFSSGNLTHYAYRVKI